LPSIKEASFVVGDIIYPPSASKEARLCFGVMLLENFCIFSSIPLQNEVELIAY
jgi:hypothetical protein